MNRIASSAALTVLFAVAGASAGPPRAPSPIRVSVVGSMAVLVHSDGRQDTMPCESLDVGRRAYFAMQLSAVRSALAHGDELAHVEDVEAAWPRITAYNEVAALCEQGGKLVADPGTELLAHQLDKAIRRFFASVQKRSA
ncbi:MAG TPA: hypothetical protein VGI11_07365 [Variovorax sp.]|jgi:hypothetical protein